MDEDDRDDPTTLRVVGMFVAVCLALLVVVLLWASRARAEELRSIDDASLAYCAIYSREAVRIDLMHTIPVRANEVSDKYITDLAVQVFKQCVSILPTLLPLPEAHRNLDSWVNDMRYLIVQRDGVVAVAGTEPATLGNEEWAAQCAAEYRTWNPDDGTVVRNGSPERVRCPCGGEVQCER